MNRAARTIFLLAAMLATTSVHGGVHDERPERPNILLVVSEDNGPHLGCYGDLQARTPRLDELAEQGALFRTVYTTASVCSPARASILTGRYAHEHGQLGLATHKHAMYRQWPNMVSLLKSSGYRTGMIGKLHINPADAFPLDMHEFRGSNFNRRPVKKMVERSMEFIDESSEPFLLVVNLPDAHFPLLAQQDGLPAEPRQAEDVQSWSWLAVESERQQEFIANYYNCLERMDSGVGMLLDGLDSRGLAEETVVIYVADHGPQFSRGKTSAYEAGLRVPLIIRAPGAPKSGIAFDELVSIVDLLPTVLDYAGVEIDEGISGRSLRPLIEGEENISWRRYLVGMGIGGAPVIYYPQYGIRDDRYKLILSPVRDRPNTNAVAYLNHHNAFFTAGTVRAEIDAAGSEATAIYARYENPPEIELYDLSTDPDERFNLADESTYRDVRERMLTALKQWRAERRDPLASDELLEAFTALNDRLLGVKYKQDPKFQWPHLETWDAYIYGEQEEHRR